MGQPTVASAATARDARFGLNQAWQAPDAADLAGAGWSRILFWWSELQKNGPNELDLFATDQDSWINDELARGRELAGGIVNTARWASSDGSPNGVPRNLYLPWDNHENYWGQFVRKLAEHYRGRIDIWIVWNEVDIHRGSWSTWNGSLEDYVQLQKVAYRAIKSTNPRATVLPFGAAWWYDNGATISRMLDLLSEDPEARAAGYFFDAANLHLYSRADDIPNVLAWYRRELATRGMEKPIWISETNAIPYDDPIRTYPKANFRATLDEQSSYMIQSFATYLAMGVKRVSVNRATDGSDFEAGGEPFGLLRNDGSARPAYAAYRVAIRYFTGVEEATFLPTQPTGLTRVLMFRPGERITVAWTMRPAPLEVSLDAAAPSALLVTKYGQTQTIEPQNGEYRLTLAPATANSNDSDRRDYVIGGDPVILVERLDGDD